MNLNALSLCLIVALLTSCGASRGRDGDSPESNPRENPFLGAELFVDPYSQAAAKTAVAKGIAKMLLKRIANQPQADWLGEWTPYIKGAVRQYLTDAKSLRQLRVMVAYNLPNRDCGRYSMGGVEGPEAYRQWIE